jgi:hypothetical protein
MVKLAFLLNPVTECQGYFARKSFFLQLALTALGPASI